MNSTGIFRWQTDRLLCRSPGGHSVLSPLRCAFVFFLPCSLSQRQRTFEQLLYNERLTVSSNCLFILFEIQWKYPPLAGSHWSIDYHWIWFNCWLDFHTDCCLHRHWFKPVCYPHADVFHLSSHTVLDVLMHVKRCDRAAFLLRVMLDCGFWALSGHIWSYRTHLEGEAFFIPKVLSDSGHVQSGFNLNVETWCQPLDGWRKTGHVKTSKPTSHIFWRKERQTDKEGKTDRKRQSFTSLHKKRWLQYWRLLLLWTKGVCVCGLLLINS